MPEVATLTETRIPIEHPGLEHAGEFLVPAAANMPRIKQQRGFISTTNNPIVDQYKPSVDEYVYQGYEQPFVIRYRDGNHNFIPKTENDPQGGRPSGRDRVVQVSHGAARAVFNFPYTVPDGNEYFIDVDFDHNVGSDLSIPVDISVRFVIDADGKKVRAFANIGAITEDDIEEIFNMAQVVFRTSNDFANGDEEKLKKYGEELYNFRKSSKVVHAEALEPYTHRRPEVKVEKPKQRQSGEGIDTEAEEAVAAQRLAAVKEELSAAAPLSSVVVEPGTAPVEVTEMEEAPNPVEQPINDNVEMKPSRRWRGFRAVLNFFNGQNNQGADLNRLPPEQITSKEEQQTGLELFLTQLGEWAVNAVNNVNLYNEDVGGLYPEDGNITYDVMYHDIEHSRRLTITFEDKTGIHRLYIAQRSDVAPITIISDIGSINLTYTPEGELAERDTNRFPDNAEEASSIARRVFAAREIMSDARAHSRSRDFENSDYITVWRNNAREKEYTKRDKTKYPIKESPIDSRETILTFVARLQQLPFRKNQ